MAKHKSTAEKRTIREESYQAPDPTTVASSAKADEPGPDDGDVARIEAEATDNGGWIVTCFKQPSGPHGIMPEPSKHAFTSADDAMTYMGDLMGATPEGGDEGGSDDETPDESDATPSDSGAPAAPPSDGSAPGAAPVPDQSGQ